MFRKLKLFSMVSVFSLVFSLGFNGQIGLAQTNPTQVEKSQTATITATAADQQAALAAWTRSARLAAKPMALPVISAAAVAASQVDTQKLGAPGSSTSGRPDAKANISAQNEFPEEWQQLSKDLDVQAAAEDMSVANGHSFLPLVVQPGPQDVTASSADATYGTAGVFTSYLTNYYSQMQQFYPYNNVGKLYIAGGGYCTASVISPKNIIVTAAHCVYDTVGNKWLGGWTFVPADRAGVAPYGAFPWSSVSILTGYINAASPDTRYDVAVIKLGNNSVGRPVTYYTGWLGRSWDWNYVQSLHAFGYPSNLNNGLYTYICAAESFSGGTDVLGMGCNMTFGSSGGPWMRVFAPYANGSVDSVVSGGTPGTNTFYGIRFTSSNIVVVCNAQGC